VGSNASVAIWGSSEWKGKRGYAETRLT